MTRRIHRVSGSASTQISDVLQSVLGAELLAPSGCLWLISPWISDVGVLDNTAGGFVSLESSWGHRSVRLSEVLVRLADLDTHIVIATRPDGHNDHFLSALEGHADQIGAAGRITIHRAAEDSLHEKGLLTDRCHVGGSMNFTYRGIVVNEEVLTVTTAEHDLAELRLTYHRRWGGEL